MVRLLTLLIFTGAGVIFVAILVNLQGEQQRQ